MEFPANALRILLVDDNAFLRDVLRTVLDSQPGLRVVGEAADGQEALERARALEPDLILLDVRMPGMSGEETLIELRQLVPSARVIALSAFEDESALRRMLDAGASAFVRKTGAPSDLLAAIARVAAQDGEVLSPTEKEVLRRVAQGYLLREIAQGLGLDVPTVEQLRAVGMGKLKVTTRADIGRLAALQGWSEPSL